MPSKGHKRAASQAKAQKKRRRGKAAVQNFEAGPIQPSTVEDTNGEAAAEPRPAAAVAPVAQPSLRGGSRRTSTPQAALTYPYLSVELRQIGMIAGLIIAILVVLTFVLG